MIEDYSFLGLFLGWSVTRRGISLLVSCTRAIKFINFNVKIYETVDHPALAGPVLQSSRGVISHLTAKGCTLSCTRKPRGRPLATKTRMIKYCFRWRTCHTIVEADLIRRSRCGLKAWKNQPVTVTNFCFMFRQ